MIRRSPVHAVVLTAAMLLVGLGCEGNGSTESDSGTAAATDARRNTDFRDAPDCAGGGGSGSGSGAGSGSGDGCGSGSGSGAPPDARPCDEMTFQYQDAEATSVWVTGSFTAWATMPPGARALTRNGVDQWTLTTQVGAGRQLYKLVIDGSRWIVDPANSHTEADGHGGQNSVLITCAGTP